MGDSAWSVRIAAFYAIIIRLVWELAMNQWCYGVPIVRPSAQNSYPRFWTIPRPTMTKRDQLGSEVVETRHTICCVTFTKKNGGNGYRLDNEYEIMVSFLVADHRDLRTEIL